MDQGGTLRPSISKSVQEYRVLIEGKPSLLQYPVTRETGAVNIDNNLSFKLRQAMGVHFSFGFSDGNSPVVMKAVLFDLLAKVLKDKTTVSVLVLLYLWTDLTRASGANASYSRS